jgi:sulfur carrier protein
MKIRLNGKAAEIAAGTLSGALEELGYADAKVATAVNEEFVPASMRAATALAEGDRIEVVAPMQGG